MMGDIEKDIIEAIKNVRKGNIINTSLYGIYNYYLLAIYNLEKSGSIYKYCDTLNYSLVDEICKDTYDNHKPSPPELPSITEVNTSNHTIHFKDILLSTIKNLNETIDFLKEELQEKNILVKSLILRNVNDRNIADANLLKINALFEGIETSSHNSYAINSKILRSQCNSSANDPTFTTTINPVHSSESITINGLINSGDYDQNIMNAFIDDTSAKFNDALRHNDDATIFIQSNKVNNDSYLTQINTTTDESINNYGGKFDTIKINTTSKLLSIKGGLENALTTHIIVSYSETP